MACGRCREPEAFADPQRGSLEFVDHIGRYQIEVIRQHAFTVQRVRGWRTAPRQMPCFPSSMNRRCGAGLGKELFTQPCLEGLHHRLGDLRLSLQAE